MLRMLLHWALSALAIWIVSRVVPADQLETYVKGYAETIGGNAPLTVNAVKFIANQTVADEGKRDLKDFVGAVVRVTIATGEPVTELKVVTASSRGFMAAVLRPAPDIPVMMTTSVT